FYDEMIRKRSKESNSIVSSLKNKLSESSPIDIDSYVTDFLKFARSSFNSKNPKDLLNLVDYKALKLLLKVAISTYSNEKENDPVQYDKTSHLSSWLISQTLNLIVESVGFSKEAFIEFMKEKVTDSKGEEVERFEMMIQL